MELTPYIESLRRDLRAAAEIADEEVRAAADRLTVALEPAVRLALMDAIAQAAAEITSELPVGTVEVRLKGREPELVVDVPAAPPADTPPSSPSDDAEAPQDDVDDDGPTARITLRIPEQLKTRAEEIAARAGISLNAWLVHAVRAATRERGWTFDIDLTGHPFANRPPKRPWEPTSRRMSGWV